MQRLMFLLSAVIALSSLSCGLKPIEIDVAPGGHASIDIEVSLQQGYKLSGKQAIYVSAPEIDGLSWLLREAAFEGPTAKMEFSVNSNASKGRRAGKLDVTVTFCEKGGTLCMIRQKEVPLHVSVNPKGTMKSVAIYSLKIKP